MKKTMVSLMIASSLLIAISGCMSQKAVAVNDARLQISVFLDGADMLKIQGNKVWFKHFAYDLPGKWRGAAEATVINGEKWLPVWDGVVSDTYTIDSANTSGATLASPILPKGQAFTEDTLSVASKGGWGNVSVYEYPNEGNDYTLSILLDDIKFEGASWYDIGIDWQD